MGVIDEVKDRVPLRPVLDSYLGAPIRERYPCPFHPSEDVHPSLKMRPDGRSYKCWSCPATGTVVDLAMYFESIPSPLDAAKFLAEKYLGKNPADWPKFDPKSRPTAPKPAKAKPGHWRNAIWQEAADDLVILGERNLDSNAGRPARDWLASQGVSMLTARRRRLGFFPEDVNSSVLDLPIRDGKPGSIWAPRGISFPWVAPYAWYSPIEPTPGPRWCGVNIRRFGPDLFADELPPEIRSKYKTFEGSERGHGYPFPHLEPSQVGPPAMIFEGEKDALVAEQEAGHLVHAFSFGGASQTDVEQATLAALAVCPWWLVSGDYDEPGMAAARRWLRMAGEKGLRPNLPFGKDLCDFAKMGGDVRGWIESELSKRGLLDRPTPTHREPFDRSNVRLGDEQTGMGDAFEANLPDTLPRMA